MTRWAGATPQMLLKTSGASSVSASLCSRRRAGGRSPASRRPSRFVRIEVRHSSRPPEAAIGPEPRMSGGPAPPQGSGAASSPTALTRPKTRQNRLGSEKNGRGPLNRTGSARGQVVRPRPGVQLKRERKTVLGPIAGVPSLGDGGRGVPNSDTEHGTERRTQEKGARGRDTRTWRQRHGRRAATGPRCVLQPSDPRPPGPGTLQRPPQPPRCHRH